MIDLTNKNWYGLAKRYLFWPILFPILALVLLDYVQVLSWFLRVWIVAYMVAWWAGGVAGLVAALAVKADEMSHWKDFFDYRLAKMLPSIRWGFDFVMWALEKEAEEAQPLTSDAGDV